MAKKKDDRPRFAALGVNDPFRLVEGGPVYAKAGSNSATDADGAVVKISGPTAVYPLVGDELASWRAAWRRSAGLDTDNARQAHANRAAADPAVPLLDGLSRTAAQIRGDEPIRFDRVNAGERFRIEGGPLSGRWVKREGGEAAPIQEGRFAHIDVLPDCKTYLIPVEVPAVEVGGPREAKPREYIHPDPSDRAILYVAPTTVAKFDTIAAWVCDNTEPHEHANLIGYLAAKLSGRVQP